MTTATNQKIFHSRVGTSLSVITFAARSVCSQNSFTLHFKIYFLLMRSVSVLMFYYLFTQKRFYLARLISRVAHPGAPLIKKRV